MERASWLDLFTGETWKEFQEHGSNISGFRESRWAIVKKIEPGDYLLCYLTGVMGWIGVLEVVDKPFKSKEPRIWSREDFPCRIKVKTLIGLRPEEAVPLRTLKDRLSYFKNRKTPNSWLGHFRGSPVREKKEDAEIIIKAIEEAKNNPIVRPVDPKKLYRQPAVYPSKAGNVTIPEEIVSTEPIKEEKEISHEEIQWLLLKVGEELGLDLWVARNDKNKRFNNMKFSEFKKVKDKLPIKFDPATNRTIELIDVLWLKGNAIEAAFEVEHSTSIYSGLLRMADLISMQPNINIRLYIVAPDSRREKVMEEVNRPTFSKLPRKLNEFCQFIPYSTLKEFVGKNRDIIKHFRPSFLDDLAEPCNLDIE